MYLLSNRHIALDSTHDLIRTVVFSWFVLLWVVTRSKLRSYDIGYAYNTDLFVPRWLISKSLEINAANFWKLKEKRLGLRSFANVNKILAIGKLKDKKAFVSYITHKAVIYCKQNIVGVYLLLGEVIFLIHCIILKVDYLSYLVLECILWSCLLYL